jgi:hypothetical protein
LRAHAKENTCQFIVLAQQKGGVFTPPFANRPDLPINTGNGPT